MGEEQDPAAGCESERERGRALTGGSFGAGSGGRRGRWPGERRFVGHAGASPIRGNGEAGNREEAEPPRAKTRVSLDWMLPMTGPCIQ